jgi:hypothetical protein
MRRKGRTVVELVENDSSGVDPGLKNYEGVVCRAGIVAVQGTSQLGIEGRSGREKEKTNR